MTTTNPACDPDRITIGESWCRYCHNGLGYGPAAYNEHMAGCEPAPAHVRTAARARRVAQAVSPR